MKYKSCRQHWLRFSWSDTWKIQSEIGLKKDTTLMLNDNPGFRNASALKWYPWNVRLQNAHDIEAQTTILMDSHLYDYKQINDVTREQIITNLVKECEIVHGSAAFFGTHILLPQIMDGAKALRCF